jgi:lysophospholipase L1-like esterase
LNNGLKVLFSLLPVALLFGLGEVGARVAGVEPCAPIEPVGGDRETMQGHPRYLWRLEPGSVAEHLGVSSPINSVGLRSRHLPDDPREPDEIRVLVTGDSSIFGLGIPEGRTYDALLEKELTRRLGRPAKVINLGTPGYSTEQTLRLLEDVGWSYEPHLVVISNIFSDCNIDAFQDRTALNLANPSDTLGRRILHSSRLYCAAYMPWARFQASAAQQGEVNTVFMPGNPIGPNQAVTLEKVDQVIDVSRVPLDDYLDNLDTIREEAEDRGASILLAPLAQEWDVGRWTVDMPKPVEGQVLPWHPYREAQREWAEDRGVGLVPFYEVFPASGVRGDQLFIDVMHPSRTGAKIMAEAVGSYVEQHPELLQGRD